MGGASLLGYKLSIKSSYLLEPGVVCRDVMQREFLRNVYKPPFLHLAYNTIILKLMTMMMSINNWNILYVIEK